MNHVYHFLSLPQEVASLQQSLKRKYDHPWFDDFFYEGVTRCLAKSSLYCPSTNSPRGWCRIVIKNHILSRLRRYRSDEEFDLKYDIPSSTNIETELIHRDTLRRICASLTRREREVIHTYFNGSLQGDRDRVQWSRTRRRLRSQYQNS